MEAIVLAGGFGTRLKQVVPDLPKPMAPVAGRPFLEILLTTLSHKGIVRCVLSLGYMADTIRNHFGRSFQGIELLYEIESTPLGTGGAVRQSLPHCRSDHVFIFNGDTYLDVELAEIEALWTSRRTPIIVAREVDDTSRFGRLVVDDGQVMNFAEKGQSGPGLINAGCYLLPTDALSAYPAGQPFSLETDYLSQAVTRHLFHVFASKGLFIDIGVPDDYRHAQGLLAGVLA